MHAHRIALLLCCILLVACGGDKAGADAAVGEDGLPKPAAASGSVTGMPNPGVPEARPATSAMQQPDIVELPEPEPVDAGDIAPVDPAAPPPPLEGPPVLVPESTMPEDPNAPPPPPEEAAQSRVQDEPRQ